MQKENTGTRPRIAESKRIKMRRLAFDSIIEMVKDTELKPSDRLSAIKVLLDITEKQQQEPEDAALTVVFENLPEGFAD